MYEKICEALWRCLQPMLITFAEQIVTSDPSLGYIVDRSSNQMFPLRAYATLRKSTDGEEIAITVDVKANNDAFTLTADACMDSGEVLVQGPFADIQLSATGAINEDAIANWLAEFETFLRTIEPLITSHASGLQ